VKRRRSRVLDVGHAPDPGGVQQGRARFGRNPWCRQGVRPTAGLPRL